MIQITLILVQHKKPNLVKVISNWLNYLYAKEESIQTDS